LLRKVLKLSPGLSPLPPGALATLETSESAGWFPGLSFPPGDSMCQAGLECPRIWGSDFGVPGGRSAGGRAELGPDKGLVGWAAGGVSGCW
jgi:hypothetical protein